MVRMHRKMKWYDLGWGREGETERKRERGEKGRKGRGGGGGRERYRERYGGVGRRETERWREKPRQ